MLEQRIEQDLKAALLGGNKTLATTLRGLKSVILYEKVAKGKREQGLEDEEIIPLFAKELKKRQESAELYKQGGNDERAEAELVEKAVIEAYLPKQLSDEEIGRLIDDVIRDLGASGLQAMGQVIGKVKEQSQGSADGARIARMTKERLFQ